MERPGSIRRSSRSRGRFRHEQVDSHRSDRSRQGRRRPRRDVRARWLSGEVRCPTGHRHEGLLETSGNGASAAAPDEAAAWAEVVFLSVPGTVAVDVAGNLAEKLAGKVVVDCNNPLVWKDGPVWTPPARRRLAHLQRRSRRPRPARVVKGFNTFGAEFHKDPGLAGVRADVFFASDDAEAKKLLHGDRRRRRVPRDRRRASPQRAGPREPRDALDPSRDRRWPRSLVHVQSPRALRRRRPASFVARLTRAT